MPRMIDQAQKAAIVASCLKRSCLYKQIYEKGNKIKNIKATERPIMTYALETRAET